MQIEATMPDPLAERWAALRADNPGLRIRQAASELNVSELELLLCREPGEVQPLKPEFPAMLETMKTVGEVMILARNESVVHEVTGVFAEFRTSSSGAMGLAVGQIDVRVFFRNWAHGFRVMEQVRSGNRESLQFFDAHGQGVQKIYRTDRTDTAGWQALLTRFLEATPVTPSLEPPRPPLNRVDRESVDAEALRRDWLALKDTHHFNAMLKRHNTDRLTALELIGTDQALRLDTPDADAADESGYSVLERLLRQVSASQCPIMVFVGNPGIVQIFTGPVSRIVPTGPWVNVLDPGFNLHANVRSISQWWRVRRPTTDGVVTSVEGYDAEGELVLTLFGERKPGQREDERWQQEVQTLESTLVCN
ncbi:hemin-degrading factor [Marinobacter nanhaiticus D15-8W]|uniref:Hemin-degrading factor n=1 Tax=Marinobacter nanhaiticus D15-8W TaxID=626887 RepID=N6WXG9_9GAMM|nr:hemin-degrading factor [Marinobacter nanhaiticus]ENO15742.1 hemin-degrading factor [Marinobacter nanhaiticus D15-8W]BES73400.1 hemin-degrading factor [Marinobacter nanhaiticus D15-8W]